MALFAAVGALYVGARARTDGGRWRVGDEGFRCTFGTVLVVEGSGVRVAAYLAKPVLGFADGFVMTTLLGLF
jgi:hypothetical protein